MSANVKNTASGVLPPSAYADYPMPSLRLPNSVAPDRKILSSKFNTLRLVAICFIVWGHSLLDWHAIPILSDTPKEISRAIMQLGKMGTIIFFVIAGYVFAEKISLFTLTSYLRYRFRSIILPWFLFVIICIFLQLLQMYNIGQIVHLPFSTALLAVKNLLTGCVFYGSYWFIPVSVISACILVLSKKLLDRPWFGLLLAFITCFYCINLYSNWIDVNHTKSLVGYTFFMWLGIWLNKNTQTVVKFIQVVSWPGILTAFLVLFFISCREGELLSTLGCKDAFASIRISNIFLSFSTIMIFLKMETPEIINQIKPEKYVYGVYLVHSILLFETTPGLNNLLKSTSLFYNFPVFLSLQLLYFLLILFFSYCVSVFIKNSRMSFLTGR